MKTLPAKKDVLEAQETTRISSKFGPRAREITLGGRGGTFITWARKINMKFHPRISRTVASNSEFQEILFFKHRKVPAAFSRKTAFRKNMFVGFGAENIHDRFCGRQFIKDLLKRIKEHLVHDRFGSETFSDICYTQTPSKNKHGKCEDKFGSSELQSTFSQFPPIFDKGGGASTE